ncbi:MAG: formylglycine-generating enzyme family protein [Planctomycetes bacterium]|nr:formylglycine-generating enzyme family protein [Planctomycetota bacterium]
MSTSLPNQSAFIHDQRIYVLDPSDGSRLSLKQALSLTGLPEYNAIDRPYSDWKHDADKGKYWKIIDTSRGRTEFLQTLGGKEASAFSERRLLCITSSAGIGKTMAVEQTKYLQSTLPDHWVIHYQFGNLPTDPEGFWGVVPLDGSSDSICERLAKYLDANRDPSSSPVWKAAVNLLLKSKMDAGQVTIIVDGLDEHDPATGVSRARALRKFLAQNPRVHCVVAGRPFSITETYWNALFATNEDRRDDSSPWEFCCVGMFTQDQIRRSLGPNRAQRILSLAGELNLTPRTIEVLRSLPDESFERISNLCDVYWESLPGTLNDDVQKKNKASSSANVGGMPTDTYIEYACALAFTMFLERKREAQYSDIADDLLERLRTLPRWQAESVESLDKRRESIKMLNAGAIEFRLFNQFDSKVIWRDNTLRDFFAALWMVRYSNEAELKQLIETIPERPREPDNNEVWEFIASMPVSAMVAGPKNERSKRWLHLAEAVFKQPEKHPRPTQLMWYAWPRLAELTAKNPEINVPAEVPSRAQDIRERFLAEFATLRKSPESAQIMAQDLSFVPIEPLDNGSWNVAVGHPNRKDNQPRRIELQGPYSVSKFPITRRLYKLFDCNHEVHYRKDFEEYCREQRCPVIQVNWYDAKMFAIWSESRLLTEWEWEYACRANRSAKDHQKEEPEHWREDPIDDEALKKLAWFNLNSQNHTWPVGAKTDSTHTNDFELVDMLGNVWEWTGSQYEEGNVSRVLRGGSFNYRGRYASASYRSHCVPTYTHFGIGFRVARAP